MMSMYTILPIFGFAHKKIQVNTLTRGEFGFAGHIIIWNQIIKIHLWVRFLKSLATVKLENALTGNI